MVIFDFNFFSLDFYDNDPNLGQINPGDVQLKVYPVGTELFKSRPLYPKQKFISKYMRQSVGDWGGQYFAFEEELAQRYGGNYLTKEKGGFHLKKYKVTSPFYALKIKQQEFGEGDISQETKALKLKEFFKVSALGNIAEPDFYKNRNNQYQQMKEKFDDLSKYLRRDFTPPSVPLITTLNVENLAMECPHDSSSTELFSLREWM